MPNNILVTGGAGFIGSFIVDALVKRNHKVRIFDNLDPRVHPKRTQRIITGSGYEIVPVVLAKRMDKEKL